MFFVINGEERELPTICRLIDTWGLPCIIDDCDEHIRTVGVMGFEKDELEDDDPTEKSELRLRPFCERHLDEYFMQQIVWPRSIRRLVADDGSPINE